MLNTLTVNISGNSRINDADIVYFNASFSGDGNFSFSQSVMVKEQYEANKDQVAEDFASFKDKVRAYMDNFSPLK